MIRRRMVVLACLLAGVPARSVPAAESRTDIAVIDQDGNERQFFADLVQGRTVAIDFFYTTCTSFCRPLSANLREVQDKLSARMGKDITLISISIDPVTDTPAQLKEFATRFDAAQGWTFVTGARPDIARLLRRLGQTLGDPEDHMPLVLVQHDVTGVRTHIDGYDPDAIASALLTAAGPPKTPIPAAAAARAYMTNPLLVTQDGRKVRLFEDLMDGRMVLINFMMTGCSSICPPETANLARVQDLLGDRLGRSVVMLSLSVDPAHDGPEELKKFAGAFVVRDGWYFLTGDPDDMDRLVHRLGGYTTDFADHSAVLIAGNVDTGTWLKLFALDDPARIVRQVLSLADPPSH